MLEKLRKWVWGYLSTIVMYFNLFLCCWMCTLTMCPGHTQSLSLMLCWKNSSLLLGREEAWHAPVGSPVWSMRLPKCGFFGSTCPYPTIKSVIRKSKPKASRARAVHVQKILGIRWLRGSERIQILSADLTISANGTCEKASCPILGTRLVSSNG